MKRLRAELRLWVAEVLLGWAFNIAPASNDGILLKAAVAEYLKAVIPKTKP